jgi:DMSO/TMAO reductase YedYZ molybdopterin-dependent catalytic subunit
MTRVARAAFLLGTLAASRLGAQAAASPLQLLGEGGVTRNLSAAELAALPQSEVTITGRDSSKVTFRGPTIRAVVSLVGAPAGHELRGPNMLVAVVAEASDGYKVAYTLSELDEQFGGTTVIVALTQNGKPLPAEEGPYRIAIGGEHRARWLRQLVRLRLVRIGT